MPTLDQEKESRQQVLPPTLSTVLQGCPGPSPVRARRKDRNVGGSTRWRPLSREVRSDIP